MPFTVLTFVYKKPHISYDDFVRRYECVHVPLVKELLGDALTKTYRRTYIDRGLATVRGAHEDFDSITELTFDTEHEFNRMLEKYLDPYIRERIDKDESVFMDKNKVNIVRTAGSFTS